MTLILASGSASRRAMLTAAGIAHEADPSDVDEDVIKAAMVGKPMSDLALELAAAKALDVSARHPGRLVLGGDSIASVGDKRFGKPASRDDAEAHLRHFSGQDMVLTSAAVLARDRVRVAEIVDAAHLSVRPLSDAFIADYLAREWPAISGCAGCFRMEGQGVQLFDRVEGDHFTILGLPLMPLLSALRAEGALIA